MSDNKNDWLNYCPKQISQMLDSFSERDSDYENTRGNTLSDFYFIRAYVLEHGGASTVLATRNYDLMNLAESLILSVPLLMGTLIYGGVNLLAQSTVSNSVIDSLVTFEGLNQPNFPIVLYLHLMKSLSTLCAKGLAILLGATLGVLTFKKIQDLWWKNYSEFRNYWIQHTCRSFIVSKIDNAS